MEENTMTMQALVMAHAAFGHNHFFRNNYLFKEQTDAGGILDYLNFAKSYIARCEERHGIAAVERILDTAHALMDQGVNRYGRRARPSLAAEAARAEAREAIGQWSQEGFFLQHYWNLYAHVEIGLYTGKYAETWENLTRSWPGLLASNLLRLPLMEVEAINMRARAALGLARAGGGRRLLQQALTDARRVERVDMPWGRPMAALLRACAARAGGDAARAADLLRAAETGFLSAGMRLHLAATRLALGVPEGREFMIAQGVRDPEAITRMIAPGILD